MQTRYHPLSGSAPGTRRHLVSFHYGPQDGGRKVYIQSSLHADELPGMLVAHHLRQRLQQLEEQGALMAEVVVVPVANPLGLSQVLQRAHMGRFELASGENFNRHYPELIELLKPQIESRFGGQLGESAAANTALIRQAMREALDAVDAKGELESQRKLLLRLAADADVVLDLHCDCESWAHLYTAGPLWPQVEPLARYLGTHANLLALESGDNPFDEACSQTWWQLQAALPGVPIELGCVSVTVELRGQADVSHEHAANDAQAILNYLQHLGHVAGDAPELPPLKQPATALEATEVVRTPIAGVVAYHKALGEWVQAGECVADCIDPLTGEVAQLCASQEGLFFAREWQRFAPAGRPLFKVAGRGAVRSGKLSAD
jgi:predicted deacylase